MRTAGILVSICLFAGAATGCKNNGGDAGAAPDPAAVKAQQDLVARRDALLAEKEKLQGESAKLATEIEQTKAGGKDTTELEKKKAEVDSKIKGQETELDKTSDQLTNISSKLDAAAGMAAREANMGTREKTLASREQTLAERERTLATREAQLAQREKETCGASAPMIIQQVAPPKGGNYTKSDVQPLLGRAKAVMQRKGILNSDLVGGAGSFESEALKAMNENDWSRAYMLASQLAATVDQMKIDRAFIQVKAARLSKAVEKAKVDDSTMAVFSDALQKYNDGNFIAANAKLNQVAAHLNK